MLYPFPRVRVRILLTSRRTPRPWVWITRSIDDGAGIRWDTPVSRYTGISALLSLSQHPSCNVACGGGERRYDQQKLRGAARDLSPGESYWIIRIPPDQRSPPPPPPERVAAYAHPDSVLPAS